MLLTKLLLMNRKTFIEHFQGTTIVTHGHLHSPNIAVRRSSIYQDAPYQAPSHESQELWCAKESIVAFFCSAGMTISALHFGVVLALNILKIHRTHFKYSGSSRGVIMDQIVPALVKNVRKISRNCSKRTCSSTSTRCWMLHRQQIQT